MPSSLAKQIAGLIAADIRCNWSNPSHVCLRLDTIEQLMHQSIYELYECTYYDVCCDGRILSSPDTMGPYGGNEVTVEQLATLGLDKTIFAVPDIAIRDSGSSDSEISEQSPDSTDSEQTLENEDITYTDASPEPSDYEDSDDNDYNYNT